MRRGLVVSQVALAFVLLIGAGLLLASFQRLLGVDPGFVAEHVLTGRVSPLQTRIRTIRRCGRTRPARSTASARCPGSRPPAPRSYLPFSWDGSSSVIIPEGYRWRRANRSCRPISSTSRRAISKRCSVPLKRGRFFTDADTQGAPRVVIVDERLAKKFWPDADPIGRRMYLPRPSGGRRRSPGRTSKWHAGRRRRRRR